MLGYPCQGTQLVHIWAGEPYASHSENVENINLAEDTLKKKKRVLIRNAGPMLGELPLAMDLDT